MNHSQSSLLLDRGRVLVGAIALAVGLIPLAGCGKQTSATGDSQPGLIISEAPADLIFTGGDIVTISDQQPTPEALAVRDGLIVFVGDEDDANAFRGEGTRVVDLGGRALLPGFIDAHSHFINALSVADQANCYAPPFGPGDTKEGIINALKALQVERDFPAGEIVMGYGYDDSLFPEGGKITAADLDAAFPENPVILGHVSLHGAVFNSLMMQRAGITSETPTPPGGVIVRKPGTNEPEGLVMETAYLPIFENLPRPVGEEAMQALIRGQQIYAAAGITTAHEGSTNRVDLQTLALGAERGLLEIDIVAFPFITEANAVLQRHAVETWGKYSGRLKLGGIKITTDGSPQGRTAWFTQPYLTGGPGGETDWHGEPTFPIRQLNTFVKSVYDLGLPLIVHCNGDAAIDAFLDAHTAALGEQASGDHRTAIIHCQFVRPDQLDRIAEYRILPSFYTEHTFFFGTTHIANRGPEQAAFLSPLRSALDRGIVFTNHTDFNVAPLDQLFTVWTAVNRVKREGGVLGPDERVTPLEALKAITINAAYWYREEDRKGSLEVGKLADLVILSANPITVEPMSIRDITVVETFKEGKSIYAAQGSGG